MTRLPLRSLLLAALLVPHLAHAACTEITPPWTIVAAGDYCLSGSVELDTTTNGIQIAADNVVLDCRGETIRNIAAPSNANSGIQMTGRKHVTVRNCRIEGGFALGIQVYQYQADPNVNRFIRIEDNEISGSSWYGIYALGTDIELEGNHIHDVGGKVNSFAMGIRVGGSTAPGQRRDILVRDNHVSTTHAYPGQFAAYGIYNENSIGGLFVDNVVVGTSGSYTWGMRIGGSGNRISGNHIGGSGLANDIGVQSNASTDACYDNHIRATTKTAVCDATLGNY